MKIDIDENISIDILKLATAIGFSSTRLVNLLLEFAVNEIDPEKAKSLKIIKSIQKGKKSENSESVTLLNTDKS